jgi:2-polyprenyl-6-hydroxyphenyl methylase/3-demethylubiquinone-9 3-methyltransferase
MMMSYYSKKLSADRLRRCYDEAPARVKQYLQAEIDHVLSRMSPCAVVLELGCGYGRVLRPLLKKASRVVGIDTSRQSLLAARELLGRGAPGHLLMMNALCLGFADRTFDMVVGIQNSLSAFKVDQETLIVEAVRVTRQGGRVLFSSYAERFWDDRLEWFELQAASGLIGGIEYEATREGTIVCKDGFRATTVSPQRFRVLTSRLGISPRLEEVDGSSLFCELEVP